MIATDVVNAVAAEEVEVLSVIHVVEIRPLGPGIDPVEPDDALRRHQRAIEMALVQLVILAQPRCDDLFQIKTHEKPVCELAGESKSGCPEGHASEHEKAAELTRSSAAAISR